MSLRANLATCVVDSSAPSLQLVFCVGYILILCRSCLAGFIISKMLFLESRNEVQEKNVSRLFQAHSERVGELLTTVLSVGHSKGQPKQVCRRTGGGSEGCEHHQGGAVPGKMWIGSSSDLTRREDSLAAKGLRGSVLGLPISSLHSLSLS